MEEARAWAPALAKLRTGEICEESGSVIRYGSCGARGWEGYDSEASEVSRGSEQDVESSEEEWSE